MHLASLLTFATRHKNRAAMALPWSIPTNLPPVIQLKLLRFLPSFLREKVQHRPALVSIIDNIAWLSMDKIARMGVGLLVGLWLARYLGPAQFGQLNFALAFVGIFGAIAGLGLGGVVVRDIVRDPEGANITLGSAFVLQVIGSVLAVGLATLAIAWMRPDDSLTRTMVAILSLGLMFKSSEVVKYWFESQVQSRHTVWVEGGSLLIVAGIKATAILLQASLLAIAWITVAEAMLTATGLAVIYARQAGQISSLKPRLAKAAKLLKDTWPFLLANLAVVIYLRIDEIMLGAMIGLDAVGVYAAAVRISEIWYFIPMMIVSSVAPSIIKAKMQSPRLYIERLQLIYKLLGVLSLGIALLITLAAGPIVGLLYGSAYEQAGIVLAIHIWAGISVALGVVSSQQLLIENLQIYSLYRTVIGCVLNITLNFILIPPYGVVGAAVATMLSYAMATFALFLFKDTRAIAHLMTSSMLFGFSRRTP